MDDLTKCHFCGFEYQEEDLLAKCDKCPMKLYHAGLGVSCCPNCGVEVRMKSSVIQLIVGLGARLKIGKH